MYARRRHTAELPPGLTDTSWLASRQLHVPEEFFKTIFPSFIKKIKGWGDSSVGTCLTDAVHAFSPST